MANAGSRFNFKEQFDCRLYTSGNTEYIAKAANVADCVDGNNNKSPNKH